MSLSQELIDHIIDLLASTPDDTRRKALLACSLVSTSFRSRCKKHLFSKLFLSYVNVPERPKNLRLQQYPTIAPYIETLCLLVSKTATLDSLSLITEMLSPLRSFVLIGNIMNRWEVVSMALDKRRHVSNPLLSSQLNSLALCSITSVPPTLFSICINLTRLTFNEVELQPSSHTEGALSEPAGSRSQPRLLEFTLVAFSRQTLVERLLPSRVPPFVDLTGLRRLTIVPATDYAEEDMIAVRELMAISKHTLRHLS